MARGKRQPADGRIGRRRHGKPRLYIKSLADIDTKELGKLIADSVA